MSLFNDKLKKITLKEILILLILLFLIQYGVNSTGVFYIDSAWIYVAIIFYFIFKLKDTYSSFKNEIKSVFLSDNLKLVFSIVILNIFLSYGFLYLSDFTQTAMNLDFVSNSVFVSVLISPVFEELVFRGVFINRLNLIIPVSYSIVLSSLIFASLHSFGNIISAFVFAICMGIIYVKTNNIVIVIFAHFLNNLIAEMVVIVGFNDFLFNNFSVFFVMSLLAVVSFVLILIWIIKQLNTIND